jgi:ABC transporter with metal-binding/Fe-S-binding domain ATP-binding protein
MNLAALISGGKDSMLAVYRMHLDGHRIKYLLAMEPVSAESYMFHHPNVWVTELISQSTGIPLIKRKTHGRKEEELSDLKSLFQQVADDVDGIVSGAMASRYQKSRIDHLCKELSLKSIAPLWHIDARNMWDELFRHNFQVMVTAVAAEGLDEKWLGRVVDRAAFDELEKLSKKHRFHLGFEGGEAETLVLDMPLYEKRITVKEARPLWDGISGSYIIEKAILEEKK